MPPGRLRLGDEAADDRVVAGHEHDWYRRGCSLGRERRRGISDDQGHLLVNQISDYIRQPMGLIFRRAVFDRDILALDEACFLQALKEGGHEVRSVSERSVPQETNNRHRRLLRARRERPRRRAAESQDERAPLHSITSSARASSVGGTFIPSAVAVLRLITS